MSVKSCEKIEKSQVVLTIEVGAPEFEAAIEKAYQKMRKKINVPGFRPGKAPRKIIEGMYGAEVFFEEAINIAFPEAYEAAVKEQELQVVGYPSVEIEGQVTRDGFTFKATAPVYPEVTLGQYKGLSAPKEEVKVSAADVDERLKALTDRNTRLVSVDREAKEGDTVVIDFEGFLEGKPFEGGKGENFSLELGSHTFVPGFEEQLVGVKAGDEKDLDITFPEDYHKDLAGKAVVFKVKVHEVKEKEIPALDDEFAKDVSEFDTLKDLKADLKKKITAEREETVKRAFEDALMEQVAENITADVPDAMVEAQSRQFLDNFKMQLAQQGLQYDQYMKATGMDEAQLLYLEAQDPDKDIQLYINSPGGSVTDGMAIYDTMQYVKCDVSTICIGMAASMGAFLLSSGAKGKRIALPNAEIMIHQPSAGTKGKVTDMEIDVEHFLRIKKNLNEILANNTGKTAEEIKAASERDHWMTAQEALDFGLIDKIITSKK